MTKINSDSTAQRIVNDKVNGILIMQSSVIYTVRGSFKYNHSLLLQKRERRKTRIKKVISLPRQRPLSHSLRSPRNPVLSTPSCRELFLFSSLLKKVKLVIERNSTVYGQNRTRKCYCNLVTFQYHGILDVLLLVS